MICTNIKTKFDQEKYSEMKKLLELIEMLLMQIEKKLLLLLLDLDFKIFFKQRKTKKNEKYNLTKENELSNKNK